MTRLTLTGAGNGPPPPTPSFPQTGLGQLWGTWYLDDLTNMEDAWNSNNLTQVGTLVAGGSGKLGYVGDNSMAGAALDAYNAYGKTTIGTDFDSRATVTANAWIYAPDWNTDLNSKYYMMMGDPIEASGAGWSWYFENIDGDSHWTIHMTGATSVSDAPKTWGWGASDTNSYAYSHVADDNWGMFTMVIDMGESTAADRVKFYVDGTIMPSAQTNDYGGSDSDLGTMSDDVLSIGGSDDSAMPSDIKIDLASVWQTALTATEVDDLYNGGAGLKPS